jgi:hypothetical protein
MLNSLSSKNDQHKATMASLPIADNILTCLAYITAPLTANTFPCTTQLGEELYTYKTWSPGRLPTLVPTGSVPIATSNRGNDYVGPANQASANQATCSNAGLLVFIN